MARKLRVYLDTSVFGGCFDPEFKAESVRLVRAIREGRMIGLISDVVAGELLGAPERIRGLAESLPADGIERLEIVPAALELRDAYVEAGVLGRKWIDDATHVALATLARADAIVSWNFKHIVRLDKIKAYNQVNLRMGYGILTILSPKEAVPDEEEN
ncbi:MAG: PIN domain-containing protein [Myxococcales bacterium]|nr:MAG: PIN domain-containing protein [Myxococcales bacterium]